MITPKISKMDLPYSKNCADFYGQIPLKNNLVFFKLLGKNTFVMEKQDPKNSNI